jgi:DNA-binding NtrC family response regulator
MIKKYVLVIDEENAVRKVIRDNLVLSGFSVSEAPDGKQGLEIINGDNPPAVVITDIIMPGKTGLDVITAIRQEHPSIRVIAISGGGRVKATDDLLQKAREIGADAILSKPLNFDELEKTVERLLG